MRYIFIGKGIVDKLQKYNNKNNDKNNNRSTVGRLRSRATLKSMTKPPLAGEKFLWHVYSAEVEKICSVTMLIPYFPVSHIYTIYILPLSFYFPLALSSNTFVDSQSISATDTFIHTHTHTDKPVYKTQKFANGLLRYKRIILVDNIYK